MIRFLKSHLVTLVGLLLVGAFLAAAAWLSFHHPRPARFHGIDVTGATFGQELGLPDTRGRVRHVADFEGRVTAVFFGYTRCPDACPTALARFKATMGLLGADANRTQVVFVSLDPDRDTPALLDDYMAAFDPRFVALRGDMAATRDIARRFKVFFERVPGVGDYTLDHSTQTYVYDPRGRLRLVIDARATPQDMAEDIRNLLEGA